jgi:hypothetical protein
VGGWMAVTRRRQRPPSAAGESYNYRTSRPQPKPPAAHVAVVDRRARDVVGGGQQHGALDRLHYVVPQGGAHLLDDDDLAVGGGRAGLVVGDVGVKFLAAAIVQTPLTSQHSVFLASSRIRPRAHPDVVALEPVDKVGALPCYVGDGHHTE